VNRLDPLVTRVLRRFISGDAEPDNATEHDSYTFTSMDVVRYLEPMYGPLRWLRFVPSLPRIRHVATWEAVTERNQLIQGRVIFHTGIGEDSAILLWPGVLVDSVT
jgi:hypothetical protein